MYKEDLALNNLQWLICHKTQPNFIHLIYIYKKDLSLDDLQSLMSHKTQPKQILYVEYISIKILWH